MPATSDHSQFGPRYTSIMASAIASCTGAIMRLDARISVSPVASAWSLRAAWSGYTRALRLQGKKRDAIDVFSWGCKLNIPGRPHRQTPIDQFDHFKDWRAALTDRAAFRSPHPLLAETHDRELPAEHPPLVRALDEVRRYARIDSSIQAWLALPFALRKQRLTTNSLACLAGGGKAMRMKRQLADTDWLATLRALERTAVEGTDRLDDLERLYRDAQGAIIKQYCQSACKRDPLSARKRDPLSGLRMDDVTRFLALRAA